MGWRDFKKESPVQKVQKVQKGVSSLASVPIVPFVPLEELSSTDEITEEEFCREFGNEPEALAQYAINLVESRTRVRGEIPNGFTTVVECKSCGFVLLPVGVPVTVSDCYWCLSRTRGLSIPRPQ